MHDAAALYTGATIQGMLALLDDHADHAYSPAGGQHHAHKASASGFCIYNDAAAAMALALEAGRRVAYLDFDAHHGDGVQAAFYDDPRALTISIHESGRYLFPGTGGADETGAGEGRGACINIPLEPGAGDAEILGALEEVAHPGSEAFSPDILVTQTGADSHHADPLTDLGATLALYPRVGRPPPRGRASLLLRTLADRGRRRLRPGGRDSSSLGRLRRYRARPRKRLRSPA